MRLSDLHRFSEIVIQLHDNPDPDAVGSGYAMYRYFSDMGKKVRLIYGGKFAVTKSNMKLLIDELHIPLEYVTELDYSPELLLTVDCQYGEGNVQRFDARNVAMIDHHRTGRESGAMEEIRSNLVSCATICYALLKNEGVDVNEDLDISTALYYGLYMDSNQLSEISHPLDRDMMDFLQHDKLLITRLKYANFSIAELETAGIAITRNNYIEKHRTAIVASEPCDPNILGVIGDFVIQVDSIDVCIIYNECPGGYKLSVRSCTMSVAANDLASFITANVGNGGGHVTKAGGFISSYSLEKMYPNISVEDYMRLKFDEYYDGYNVVSFTEVPDLSTFKRYRKKAASYGYVVSTELFPEGTECKLRTIEGDVMVTCKEDIYLMIGYLGEVYPIEKQAFDKKYSISGNGYSKEFEYPPTVINLSEGKPYALMPKARECIAGAGAVIYAKPLEKFTKVITRWDYEGYMSGNKNDMICYTDGDDRDVYIAQRDIFDATYEEI